MSTQWARCHLCHQRPSPIFKRMGLRVQHDFRGVSSFCKSWQKLIPANIVTQKNMRKVIWEIFSAMGWNINPVLIKYLFYCYYFLGWINNICSLLITALRAIDIHGIWQPRPSTLTQLQWILPLGKMPPALNEIITSLSLCRGTWLCPSFSAKKPVYKGFFWHIFLVKLMLPKP